MRKSGSEKKCIAVGMDFGFKVKWKSAVCWFKMKECSLLVLIVHFATRNFIVTH